MKKILVLFNLKEGVDAADNEGWARGVDLPSARALGSVLGFNVYRAEGLFGSDQPPPYQYAEWLQVTSPEALGADAQSETMTAVVQAFGNYADNPCFIVMDDIE